MLNLVFYLNGIDMSFGYCILTNKKVDFLIRRRFRLLAEEKDIYIYFLEFEGMKLFVDRTHNEITLTQSGLQLFKEINDLIKHPFLFSYTLLKNRESLTDFAYIMRKKIESKNIPRIASGNEIIRLREIYFVDFK